MKKELLMGTALVGTLGAASVAEAVTMSMSGNHTTGIEFESATSGTDLRSQINDNNFSLSLSETTDGGMTISSSMAIVNEVSAAGGTGTDMDAGFSLAFPGGSKLDVINAGNAADSHDISVPASAGEESVAVTTTNNAPTGLNFMAASTVYGVEFHTPADFMVDGLAMSFSASTDDNASNAATYSVDGHYALGGTYVSDLGDSAITVGFADGDSIEDTATTEVDGDVMKIGAKYVSGDFTFNVGHTSGEANDSATFGTPGTTTDSYEKTSASVSYAVAAGVTANLGYSAVDSAAEGVSDSTDGSAWYIGAAMSF